MEVLINGTNITEFRAQLKEWMDKAQEGPVRVNRPNGKAVVLLDAETYEKMALDLAELRGVVKGLRAVVEGRTMKYSSEDVKKVSDGAEARFKARHSKKAAV
ncbi:MAG: type II toxin-antitoxin system Phd/YefM family antitoxin [Bdellovibrio sp.]|nr:type II toxin-antitoxin system Phd/YefM family antitoxin [Bdellovibrio sp.]